ncbi:MAG: rhodanese-like domain-containing protein, partial [Bacteroidales bacterium]
MEHDISVNDFIFQSNKGVIVDVRTPAEFEQGHIPGAVNMPLFTNEERVIIGTLYKKQGKDVAVEKGL